jgi:hypothetical protein
MKARVNKQDESLIAAKIGGINHEILIYNLKNKDDEL